MNKTAPKGTVEKSLESRNCLAILALVTEMARHLNENISKIQLEPLSGGLGAAGSRRSALAGADNPLT